MLRIVTKATSIESFVQLFSRLCTPDSIYVVTREPADMGTNSRFAITLADGQPAITGAGHVEEVYRSRDNRYGHPGMKLLFVELDERSRTLVQHLVEANPDSAGPPLPAHLRPPPRPGTVPPKSHELQLLAANRETQPSVHSSASLAMIGELSEGAIESIVQCIVHSEHTETTLAALASVPVADMQAASSTRRKQPSRLPGVAPTNEEASAATAPPAESAPLPVPPASSQETLPMPVTAVPMPPELAQIPEPAAARPAPLRSGGQAQVPTQMVRQVGRPGRGRTIFLSFAVVLVIAAAGVGFSLWRKGSRSSGDADPSQNVAAAAQPDATPVDAGTPDSNAAPGNCQVTITSKPPGADVTVGENVLGTTPLETTLPCGEVELEVKRSRYEPARQTAVLRPDRVNQVEVRLDRPQVELEVTSKPGGADVLINGKKVGETPVTVRVDGYKNAQVTVRKSGYRSFRKRVYAKPPKVSVKAKLRKKR